MIYASNKTSLPTIKKLVVVANPIHPLPIFKYGHVQGEGAYSNNKQGRLKV